MLDNRTAVPWFLVDLEYQFSRVKVRIVRLLQAPHGPYREKHAVFCIFYRQIFFYIAYRKITINSIIDR